MKEQSNSVNFTARKSNAKKLYLLLGTEKNTS